MSNKTICIIPARSGSKGIPGKNIKILNNKLLILSTDAPEIAKIGVKIGLEVILLRPQNISTDVTPMIDVIEHAINSLSSTYVPDIICILKPTSPLRDIKNLVEGYKLLIKDRSDSVVSIEKMPNHYSPYTAMKIINNKLEFFIEEGNTITRRQDVEDVYLRSGCFYFLFIDTLLRKKSLYGDTCLPILINNEHNINIDTADDWEDAFRISKKLSKI